MKVLVIGSGGREHALVWKLSKSPRVDKIFVAPGNGGTREIAVNVDISESDIESLLGFAICENIDMTIVGPEDPLVHGIVDLFRLNGLRIIGPDSRAARLEGSKAFAKRFMTKYGIPTARYGEYMTYDDAIEALEDFGLPVAIKADGLAGGKGVVIAETESDAKKALYRIMVEKIFGDSGRRVIIEEFLSGVEASIMCFIDNGAIIPMPPAQDYKKQLDGDRGLNTGGMGAYSPSRFVTGSIMEKIRSQVLDRTLSGIKNEGMDYRGVIFIGLMIQGDEINVLEYNVRFGDPETQATLPRLESDIVDVFDGVERGGLSELGSSIKWSERSCACVVMTSGGYPEKFKQGYEIKYAPGMKSDGSDEDAEAIVFQAGTAYRGGVLRTQGGRVLCVSATGDTVEEASGRAYEKMEGIDFKDSFHRKDIGR